MASSGVGTTKKRSGPKSRTSPFKGVTQYKRTGKWEAHIWIPNPQVGGHQRHLGSYHSSEDAARAYDRVAIRVLSRSTELNFPAAEYEACPFMLENKSVGGARFIDLVRERFSIQGEQAAAARHRPAARPSQPKRQRSPGHARPKPAAASRQRPSTPVGEREGGAAAQLDTSFQVARAPLSMSLELLFSEMPAGSPQQLVPGGLVQYQYQYHHEEDLHAQYLLAQQHQQQVGTASKVAPQLGLKVEELFAQQQPGVALPVLPPTPGAQQDGGHGHGGDFHAGRLLGLPDDCDDLDLDMLGDMLGDMQTPGSGPATQPAMPRPTDFSALVHDGLGARMALPLPQLAGESLPVLLPQAVQPAMQAPLQAARPAPLATVYSIAPCGSADLAVATPAGKVHMPVISGRLLDDHEAAGWVLAPGPGQHLACGQAGFGSGQVYYD